MKAGDSITVTLGGQPHVLPEGTTLARLVTLLGHAPAGVTTAVNGLFVPRHQRNERVLADDDAVLLFEPIVAG